MCKDMMGMMGSSSHAFSSSCLGSSLTQADTKKVDMNQQLLYIEIKYMYIQNYYFSYHHQIVTLQVHLEGSWTIGCNKTLQQFNQYNHL